MNYFFKLQQVQAYAKVRKSTIHTGTERVEFVAFVVESMDRKMMVKTIRKGFSRTV